MLSVETQADLLDRLARSNESVAASFAADAAAQEARAVAVISLAESNALLAQIIGNVKTGAKVSADVVVDKPATSEVVEDDTNVVETKPKDEPEVAEAKAAKAKAAKEAKAAKAAEAKAAKAAEAKAAKAAKAAEADASDEDGDDDGETVDLVSKNAARRALMVLQLMDTTQASRDVMVDHSASNQHSLGTIADEKMADVVQDFRKRFNNNDLFDAVMAADSLQDGKALLKAHLEGAE